MTASAGKGRGAPPCGSGRSSACITSSFPFPSSGSLCAGALVPIHQHVHGRCSFPAAGGTDENDDDEEDRANDDGDDDDDMRMMIVMIMVTKMMTMMVTMIMMTMNMVVVMTMLMLMTR